MRDINDINAFEWHESEGCDKRLYSKFREDWQWSESEIWLKNSTILKLWWNSTTDWRISSASICGTSAMGKKVSSFFHHGRQKQRDFKYYHFHPSASSHMNAEIKTIIQSKRCISQTKFTCFTGHHLSAVIMRYLIHKCHRDAMLNGIWWMNPAIASWSNLNSTAKTVNHSTNYSPVGNDHTSHHNLWLM